jgi:hypothetical protein
LKDVPAENAVVARPAPAPQPPAKAAQKPPAPAPPLRFGARYELSWLEGGPHFADGPGVILALALPVGFELGAFYRRPLNVEATPVGVRLEAFAARALVTLQTWHGERASLRFGAGAGADLVHVSPLGEPNDAELSRETWLQLAVARVQATYAWRAVRFLELELTAGVDLDVNDTHYVFQQGSGELRVFDPWPVRPFVSLGAALP